LNADKAEKLTMSQAIHTLTTGSAFLQRIPIWP